MSPESGNRFREKDMRRIRNLKRMERIRGTATRFRWRDGRFRYRFRGMPRHLDHQEQLPGVVGPLVPFPSFALNKISGGVPIAYERTQHPISVEFRIQDLLANPDGNHFVMVQIIENALPLILVLFLSRIVKASERALAAVIRKDGMKRPIVWCRFNLFNHIQRRSLASRCARGPYT